MKQRITVARLSNYLVALVLALVPFHGFLTVFGSSLVGHYTALRLWDDVLLLVLLGVSCWWLARDKPLRDWFFGSLLVRLIVAYTVLSLLLGAVALAKGDVTVKALGYGLLLNLRFLAWFLAVLLTAQKSDWLKRAWLKLLLIPAALVVVFAVLQYTVLPHTFLSHFGYNADTNIAPIETINHNRHYIRVQSTLRGANPLGAYLVVVLSVLGAMVGRKQRRVLITILCIVSIIALFASGSRSAWIGAVLAAGVVGLFRMPAGILRRNILFGTGALIIVLAALGMVFRHNTALQNALFHTADNSTVATSSNEAHTSAVRGGLKDIVHQPLGDGPGTAGPASVYNGNHPARIAENYYVQIAQETGWIGLVLFVCILVLVAMELFAQIRVSRLSLVLLASFIGIAFVNMLSHAWADDTLAYLWWGLAGIALAQPVKSRETDA